MNLKNSLQSFCTLAILALLVGCGDSGGGPVAQPDATTPDAGGPDTTVVADVAPDAAGPEDVGEEVDEPGPVTLEVEVEVLLDGQPSPDTLVMQGGGAHTWTTDGAGRVTVTLDLTVPGELYVLASHPEARVRGTDIWLELPVPELITLALERFDTSDNEAYLFQDPGVPGDRATTGQCGHCHRTINDDWSESVHRGSASNPTLLDLYSGTASGWETEAACLANGGTWEAAPKAGGGPTCKLGDSVLDTGGFGACADCHAPGIDGALGGRDLLEATGFAREYGVHCDVCHRVESIDLDAEPGVAGRLKLLRPSESSISVALGLWLPITFGPSHDSPNIRMGSVQRDHFHEAALCAGCHEQLQPVLVPGAAIDTARWPSGRLPVHTTFSEWEAGPMNPAAPCQSCHMPPASEVLNSADLQQFENATTGVQGGWHRPPGFVRHHSWPGPRDPEAGMLQLAASVSVAATVDGEEMTAAVTVRNEGPGHAIPTGEPLRSMVLVVEATCGDAPLVATGGDAVPDFGGYLDRREASEGWDTWPGAEVGQLVRVVARTGEHHDYTGYGPFGDGTFDVEAKGLLVEQVVGASTIVAVDGDEVTFDAPLPDGDVAYRVDGVVLPRDGGPADAWAGAPGFAFARVLVGADGGRMVPHFAAVDVASDNRLLPRQAWTSEHRFAAPCEDPAVEAVLVHRAYPLDLARERGWTLTDSVMATATATQLELVEPEPDPADTGQTLEITLEAAATATGYAYNGQVPGPTLRATVGDTLVVHLVNGLDDPTTIHWHGVHVPWAMDGVAWQQDPVMPGETFTYTFPLTHAGTFWYHPHVDTERQVDLGLYGALVVEEADAPEVEDVVLVLDAAAEHPDADGHAHGGWPPGGWTVNGAPAPATFEYPAGTTVRARLINAANTAVVALSGDGLRVIGGDQGLLPAAQTPARVVLAPGDRVELEWSVGDGGLSFVREPWSVSGPAWGEPEPFFDVVATTGGPAPGPVDWPFPGGEPSADRPGTDLVYVFAGSDEADTWLINGEAFPEITVAELPLGADAIVELRNLSPTDHPFHLHGHAFEVLSVDGQPSPYRSIEDTVNVPAHGTARLRLVADNPGDWMAHCHILPHVETGMMTVLRVTDP